MKLALIGILGLLLTGCASLQYAGVAHYSVETIEIDGKPTCCKVTVINGKEIAEVTAKIVKKGDDYEVFIHETDIDAFKGQEIASEATQAAIAAAAKAAVAAALAPIIPALAPVAGAALASPGIGAAAIGAGAAIGIQKIAE